MRLSHAELDARGSRFAHHLLQHIGSGRQIGLLCVNPGHCAGCPHLQAITTATAAVAQRHSGTCGAA